MISDNLINGVKAENEKPCYEDGELIEDASCHIGIWICKHYDIINNKCLFTEAIK